MHPNGARQIYIRKSLSRSLQGIWEYPLTVLQAPMGYGKTTAVREFLQGCQAQVLWQSVFDSSVAAFWKGFCHLLIGIDPDCAQRLAAIGVPGDRVFREEAVELLSGVKFADPTVIVIDDYHYLSAPGIDRFFERLTLSNIPGLHIVIVSRNKFGENTAELALKGYCLVLDRRQFELTPAETADYCKLYGVRLKEAEAAFLEEYAEGWISAIYLCIQGYRQTGRLERQPASLHDLIDRVIYQPCSHEIKEFLTAISVYDNFSLAQAENIWQKGDAGELLSRLTAFNAFITFDQSSGIYSLHNIFSAYLRHIFDRQELARRQALWKLAGEWYVSAGNHISAMEHFYKAGDFEQLMGTLDIAHSAESIRQPKEIIIRYFEECPVEIMQRHLRAGFRHAFFLFMVNEPARFSRHVSELQHFINASSALDAENRRKLLGELAIIKGITAYNDVDAMLAQFETAWELLQGPSLVGDPKGSLTLGAPSMIYSYYRESGGLQATVQTVLQKISYFYRLSGDHGYGSEYFMEAELYYNTGDFENAEITAHKALQAAKSKNQTAIIIGASFLLMRLALVKGDWRYIYDTLRQTRELVKQQDFYPNIHTQDMSEGFLFACLGRRGRIPSWIAEGDLPGLLPPPCHPFCHIIRLKTLLADGRHREAVGIADALVATVGYFHNLLAMIYIYCCQAAALEKLGRRQEALGILEKAIVIAAPDNVIMPFVENYEYLAELLAALQPTCPQRNVIVRIRKIAPPIIETWQGIRTKMEEAEGKLRLSPREKEIAGLVAAGLSNPAIGKQLNIAEDTVKKTLKKMFLKLGVGSRTALTRIITEQQI